MIHALKVKCRMQFPFHQNRIHQGPHGKQSGGVIFDIWYGTVQLWIYACIQRLMFLQPRITGHSFYPKALSALKSSSELHILVRPASQ